MGETEHLSPFGVAAVVINVNEGVSRGGSHSRGHLSSKSVGDRERGPLVDLVSHL